MYAVITVVNSHEQTLNSGPFSRSRSRPAHRRPGGRASIFTAFLRGRRGRGAAGACAPTPMHLRMHRACLSHLSWHVRRRRVCRRRERPRFFSFSRTLHPKVYPVQAGGGFNVYWQTPLSEATKLQGICVENEAMYRPVRPNLLMGRGWPMLAGVGAAWGDRGLS